MQAAMSRGQQFAPPYLDYSETWRGQEGLNRAVAAKQLGIKEIPVIVFTKVDEQARILAEIARKK
jgi:hypothetical protein